jgi:uncharacterized protein
MIGQNKTAIPKSDNTSTQRVVATPAALDAILQLRKKLGPIIFFQSGGCCDASAPMCFEDGELIIGPNDLLLGIVGGSPFYIDEIEYEVWKHAKLILDIEDGEAEGFSLAASPGKHFVVRSELCTL